MIPQVRRWRVRYYHGTTVLFETTVDAPTKLFARWEARDKYVQQGRLLRNITRVTVGLLRKRKVEVIGRKTWGEYLPAFAPKDEEWTRTRDQILAGLAGDPVAIAENHAEVMRLDRKERDDD